MVHLLLVYKHIVDLGAAAATLHGEADARTDALVIRSIVGTVFVREASRNGLWWSARMLRYQVDDSARAAGQILDGDECFRPGHRAPCGRVKQLNGRTKPIEHRCSPPSRSFRASIPTQKRSKREVSGRSCGSVLL